MCELLVGLPDVNVLSVVDAAGEPLRMHVETRDPRPASAADLAQASLELPELLVPGGFVDG